MKWLQTIGLLILGINALVVLMVGLVLAADWLRQRSGHFRGRRRKGASGGVQEGNSGNQGET